MCLLPWRQSGVPISSRNPNINWANNNSATFLRNGLFNTLPRSRLEQLRMYVCKYAYCNEPIFVSKPFFEVFVFSLYDFRLGKRDCLEWMRQLRAMGSGEPSGQHMAERGRGHTWGHGEPAATTAHKANAVLYVATDCSWRSFNILRHDLRHPTGKTWALLEQYLLGTWLWALLWKNVLSSIAIAIASLCSQKLRSKKNRGLLRGNGLAAPWYYQEKACLNRSTQCLSSFA